MQPEPYLIPASPADYAIIQNMARFYVYDMSRYCGYLPGWECPEDGLFESIDFKSYFNEPDRFAFLVKIGGELAGFALINKAGTYPETDWNMGEFFILTKFQGKSIGRQVVAHIWNRFPGSWEVAVIPENARALHFWRKAITHYTKGDFTEKIRKVDYDADQPERIIFQLKTPPRQESLPFTIRAATVEDARQIASVHIKAWQESYKNIVSQPYLDNISYEEKLALRKEILQGDDGSLHIVAEIDGTITGFCDAGLCRDNDNIARGEVYTIYILEEYKGRRIGTALWNMGADYLAGQGLTPFITWVLEANKPARAFYEKMGGKPVKTQDENIGGDMHRLVCYIFN